MIFEIDIQDKKAYLLEMVQKALSQSDWTQLPDSGLSMSKRLEWQAYRDDLRSIQDDFTNPDDVIFPTPPAEEE